MSHHLAFGEPVEAVARDGIVCIFVDPGTARDLANAWEFTYASGGLSDLPRPHFLLDCSALKNAAIEADRQNGELAKSSVRQVPLARQPHLRLVGGES